MKISFLLLQLHKSRPKLKAYYVHNRDMPCSYFFYRISFRFYGLDNFKGFYVIFTLFPCRVKIALVALWFYTVHKFISINLVWYIEVASNTLNVMKLFCDMVQHSCSMPSLTKLITIMVWNICKNPTITLKESGATPMSDLQGFFFALSIRTQFFSWIYLSYIKFNGLNLKTEL